MLDSSISIRPFLGSKDYKLSQSFYEALGFMKLYDDDKLSYFRVKENIGFYLQAYYNTEWVNNTMVFLEIPDPEKLYEDLKLKELDEKYPGAGLKAMQYNDWGKEFFLHDPSGNLWHFGEFSS